MIKVSMKPLIQNALAQALARQLLTNGNLSMNVRRSYLDYRLLAFNVDSNFLSAHPRRVPDPADWGPGPLGPLVRINCLSNVTERNGK